MKIAIFAVLVALCMADDAEKDKRQILAGGFYPGFYNGGIYPGGFYPGFAGGVWPGAIVGRKRREAAAEEDVDERTSEDKHKRQILAGGFGYPAFGLGYGYGYPGVINTGFGFPAVYGRKRRDTADVEEHKEKRQILAGGFGYPAFGLGGFGGYGYGYPGVVNTGFGFPAVYGRKRRDTEDVEKEHKEKRQLLATGLVGAAPILGAGYVGAPLVGGVGYPGVIGAGVVNTGFGYPAVYGRKRRDTDAVAEHIKEKRQILAGGFGYPAFGLGYGYGYPGVVNTGFGFPAIYGRKRRDTEDVEEEHKEKRQLLATGVVGAGYPAVVGAGYPVGVVGAGVPVAGVAGYPGVVGAGYPVGGVVGAGYPGGVIL